MCNASSAGSGSVGGLECDGVEWKQQHMNGTAASSTAWRRQMFEPVDATSLVVFRIGFGLLMLVDVVRYWGAGWISRYYIEPDFHFRYFGFEWVQPWAGDGMYWHFAARRANHMVSGSPRSQSALTLTMPA